MDEPDENTQLVYRFFTEIGILSQLSRSGLERHLPGTMTATQFAILGHLLRRPDGETPLQLAKAFQVPKTSMTHSLAVLESAQLVALGPNPTDGRSKLVTATPHAGPFVAEVLQKRAAEMSPVLDAAGLKPFKAALPELQKIRELMDKARD